jgi:hypothetical protein
MTTDTEKTPAEFRAEIMAHQKRLADQLTTAEDAEIEVSGLAGVVAALADHERQISEYEKRARRLRDDRKKAVEGKATTLATRAELLGKLVASGVSLERLSIATGLSATQLRRHADDASDLQTS